METILTIMGICSFILGVFVLVSKMTGNIVVKILFKIIGFGATITPIIYWLMLWGVLK